MYALMQLPDLIAANEADYVARALRLATDPAWQAELRSRIRARSGVLFDNPTWSRALQAFCRGLVA